MVDVFDPYGMSGFFRMKDFQQEAKFSKPRQCFVRQRDADGPKGWTTARVVPRQEAGHSEQDRDVANPPSRDKTCTSLSWLTRNLLGYRKDGKGLKNSRHHPGRSYVPVETEGGPLDLPREFRREEFPPKVSRKPGSTKAPTAKVLVGGVIQDAPDGFLGPSPYRTRRSQSLARRASPKDAPPDPTQAPTISTIIANPVSIANYSHTICQGIMQRSSSCYGNASSSSLRSTNVSENVHQILPHIHTPRAAENSESCRPTPLLVAAARMALSTALGGRLSSSSSPPPAFGPSSLSHIHDPAVKEKPSRSPCPPVIGAFSKWKPGTTLPPNIEAQPAGKRTLPGSKVYKNHFKSDDADSSKSAAGITQSTVQLLISSRSRCSAAAAAVGMGEPPTALTNVDSVRSKETYLNSNAND